MITRHPNQHHHTEIIMVPYVNTSKGHRDDRTKGWQAGKAKQAHIRKKIQNTIENIIVHLSQIQGSSNVLSQIQDSSNVLLSYIIQDDPNLLARPSRWPTTDTNIIHRTPHNGIYFDQDNEHIWNIIWHVLYNTDRWSWVLKQEQQMEGQYTYLSILTT